MTQHTQALTAAYNAMANTPNASEVGGSGGGGQNGAFVCCCEFVVGQIFVIFEGD